MYWYIERTQVRYEIKFLFHEVSCVYVIDYNVAIYEILQQKSLSDECFILYNTQSIS